MKKILFLFCSLFTMMGAWATDYVISTETGTFYRGGTQAITVSESSQYGNLWTANDQVLSLQCTKNDIVIDAAIRFATDTYTLSVQGGYLITGYSFEAYTGATTEVNVTPNGQDAIAISTDAANPTTVAVTGLSSTSAVFNVVAGSPWMNVSSFTVTVEVDENYVAPVYVTTLSELSNTKAYRLTTKRGSLGVNDNTLVATIKGYEPSDFALLTYKDQLYLYSIEAKAFINSQGIATNENPEPITLSELGDNLFEIFFGELVLNVSGGYTPGLVINGWTTLDDGNQFLIQEMGDFDPAEALSAFYEFPYSKYLVQNVATGKYWSAGNDWGTRASLVDNPEFLKLVPLPDGTYNIETQVNNGGTQYYFNGDYMDNGAPVAINIAQNGDYYTFQNVVEGIYYGWDGSSTILGKTETDGTAANVQWTIVSLDDAKANLVNATQESPLNATFLIDDANFGRNNRYSSKWTVDAANSNLSGGNNINNCAESWQSAFTISQSVEAPNGIYKVTAQAALTDYTNAYDGVDYPVVFANDETSPFNSMDSSDRGTNMSTLSASFTAGKYYVNPIYVEVTDGTLTVGVKGTRTNTWAIWDNFTIMYYGTEANLDELKFGGLIAQVEELRTEAQVLKNNVDVSSASQVILENALAETETIEGTEEAYQAAIATLTDAINKAKLDVNNKPAIDAMYEIMAETNVYTQEAYDAYKALADGYLAQYNEGTLTTAIENPKSLMGWHAANDVDDLLLSAWGTSNYDTDLYINTWSVEGVSDGTNFLVPFFEYWTGDANSLAAKTHTATLENIPAGKYNVSAWVRVRAKNGYAAPVTGINLQVNDGEAVDVIGSQVGESQFFIGNFTAESVVGEDGKMEIKFNVAEDNNISWLSFKNVMYEKVYEATNLDFSESTPVSNGICTYAKDMEANGTIYSQMQEVEGWDIAVENGDARASGVFAYGADENVWLGGKGYLAPATNPEGAAEGNALGIVAVWSATTQYTQKVTLPAGSYVMTVPIYNSVGGASVPVKSLIGFIAGDGTEYLAPAKAYAVGQWTNEVITFTLPEATTGVISLGYQGQNVGSGSAQHLFIDRVDIQAVTDVDVVRAELEQAIAAANATIEAREGVGEGLFAIPESALEEYMNAVYAAQDVDDKADATAEELQAAIDALAAATAAYNNSATQPDADKFYTFKQKESGLYLSLYDDGENGNGVRLAEEPQPMSFVPAEGGYYITDGTLFVGLAGTNNWTMSALADNKLVITVNNLGNGEYTLGQIKGFIGTDGTEVGAACYSDKSVEKVGDRAIWFIEEAADPNVLELAIDIERMVGQGYAAQRGTVDFTEALAFLGVENITDAQLFIKNVTNDELIADYAPYDGWFNRDGDAQFWGDNASVCVKFFQALPEGQFDICDMDNANVPAVGETFTAKWALQANEKTVVYTINVLFTEYVEPVYKPEIVKTIVIQHMEAAETAYDEEGVAPTFNVNEVCEALGIDNIDDAETYIVNVTTGNFVPNTTDGWRNIDGDAEGWGTATTGFCLKLNDPASGIFDYSGAHDINFKVGDTYVAKWGIVYNDKAVVLEVDITFVDSSVLTGINTIASDLENAEIYNLNGVKVNQADRLQKGVYIINGKKVVVK